MCLRGIVAAVLLLPVALSGQEAAVLRIRVTLTDTAGQQTPVARHTLLVSDNPATGAPKVVRTAIDGTAELTLAPGPYAVESERVVMFEGRGYEWFQYLDLTAGQTVTLELTAANAEIAEPASAGASGAPPGAAGPDAPPETDPIFLLGQWQRSVVAIWSPTARATGVLVDPRGLIATDRAVVGSAPTVAVQLSATVKVPARVLDLGAPRDVAIVWVSPTAIADRPAVPLDCDATQPLVAAAAGDEILAITTELGRPTDVTWGDVVSPGPPRLATNMQLSTSGAGGPVFDEAGRVIGLTTIRRDPDSPRWHEVEVIPAVRLCAALAGAGVPLAQNDPPEAVPLPVESTRPFPASALEASATGGGASAPLMLSSEDFDVAFITPPAIHQARRKADWTGGGGARAPEAEARLGRLTDFGEWSAYFADAPAVVAVRVTPKMVEGFWKRVAREAARTQGAELPAFKQFKTSFVGLTLRCGDRTIAPLHPLVLDHQLAEDDLVREGLYVFDPGAFDPQCTDLRLDLLSARAPDRPDTVEIGAAIRQRLWSDFAPWREASR